MAKTPMGIAPMVGRLTASAAAVAVLTYLGYKILPINATTQGFLYLIAILFLATGWGLSEAVVASVIAVLCLNYFFLPPVGTFTIADPQNWTALVAFLITAITASRLSATARRRALEVLERQKEVERLYALSRAILLTEPSASMAKEVAGHIAQTFTAPAVVLYTRTDHAFYRAGPEDFPESDARLQDAAIEGTRIQKGNSWITAIRLGGEPIGSVGIRGVDLSDSALESLANLAAIGLERARAQEAATRAEVSRQSDQLKSTLLDAIAHEFQTPLTTIKAATSALLAQRAPVPQQSADLLHLVDDETQRLSRLVSDAIRMARIEAGNVRLHRQPTAMAELIAGVLAEKKSALEDRLVTVQIPPDLPRLEVDPELTAMALRQLIDNAVKYSDAGTAIDISARRENDQAIISVHDRGQGIPESELAHVFEKFYRGRQSRGQITGAGLGLAIARAVIDAHGGRIWAESVAGKGANFRIALPITPVVA